MSKFISEEKLKEILLDTELDAAHLEALNGAFEELDSQAEKVGELESALEEARVDYETRFRNAFFNGVKVEEPEEPVVEAEEEDDPELTFEELEKIAHGNE